MEKLHVQGGRQLKGDVRVSGAKNAILPLMAASLLLEGPLQLHNIPPLHDVETMLALLQQMGVAAQWCADETLSLNASAVQQCLACYDLVRRMRASILVLGPLLTRFGHAEVALPGGCAIGARPVDFHITALRQMGADVVVEEGYIKAQGRLRGADIHFTDVTVTGTENIMMAAVLAQGETVLHNAAMEPEVVELATCLNQLGAKITGAGTPTIHIQGVTALRGGEYHVIGDRIEAATLLIAAVMTQGHVCVRQFNPAHCRAVLLALQEAGALVNVQAQAVEIDMRGKRPKAVSIVTAPYPDFPTDAQAQFMALNTIADGRSVISETIFENRFMHAEEMRRMGADIQLHGHNATCIGVEHLTGVPVVATDLRASASLVLAGLVAEGVTVIDQIYHLNRGYAGLENKLACLGGSVRRVRDAAVVAECKETL